MRKKPAPAPPDSREWDSLFAIPGHEWIPHDWLDDYPCAGVLRDFGPGKLALVREVEWRNRTKTVFDLALDADANAIGTLVRQTMEGCRVLRELTEAKPELLRPYARKSWAWPVLKSLHPHLSDDHEKILKTLQLGADTPLEIDASARWVNDPAHNIAFPLLNYLWAYR